MFNSYKIRGIILKRTNFGEADKILTVFSKSYGKLSLIGKGIRKMSSRRAPHLELFNHAVLFIHRGKNIDIVTEAETLKSFAVLKKDLKKVTAAYYLAELVDRLCPERQEHDDILVELIRSMEMLNQKDFLELDNLLYTFSLKVLISLGFLPQGQPMSSEQLKYFIEDIIEGRMKTRDLLAKI